MQDFLFAISHLISNDWPGTLNTKYALFSMEVMAERRHGLKMLN